MFFIGITIIIGTFIIGSSLEKVADAILEIKYQINILASTIKEKNEK